MKPEHKTRGGNARNTRTTHPNKTRRQVRAQERCAATQHRIMTVKGEDGKERPAEEPKSAVQDGRCGKCGQEVQAA